MEKLIKHTLYTSIDGSMNHQPNRSRNRQTDHFFEVVQAGMYIIAAWRST